ncbi:16S rRNA (uracil(1498)-N(3))-methyltransferase [Alkalibacter mobilis]|uniref:16S rRNA (uracil(1498)-N(3))-methyltransferase n=1 Tax=Alkalibacter mobilis TaxID=2787712 RepID=UPI00189EE965|nr:16S rRNA (uracil(1498)-N(3))-methyltransferase [Alkalibacter mobilis]MBF7096863.1 16S rRNA (uracil(1498)-N(3))-methyltransferase [Alkalibacter mobilis]
MHRFFIDESFIDLESGRITITGEDHMHISKSLRMRVGEKVVICDGKSNDYICEIDEINKKETLLSIVDSIRNDAEMDVRVTLYQGLSKGHKMDTTIQKCVELGVDKITPVITERTVSLPSDKDKKIQRWNKISMEAAKQSGRGMIPEVTEILSFQKMIEKIKNDDLKLVAYENERSVTLKDLMEENKRPGSIGIIIGPEGGFTSEEIAKLQQCEGKPISLGKRILRTETAAMALMAMLVYRYEL